MKSCPEMGGDVISLAKNCSVMADYIDVNQYGVGFTGATRRLFV